MPHEHAESIEQVVTEVLEHLAFVFADPAEADELPAALTDGIAVRIGIHGAGTGTLTIVSGYQVCAELAGNLTGEDADDIDPQSAAYALMELANVLCGQLLTHIAGVEPVFDLEPPAVLDDPAGHWQRLRTDDQTVAFLADDCPIAVRLELGIDLAQAA